MAVCGLGCYDTDNARFSLVLGGSRHVRPGNSRGRARSKSAFESGTVSLRSLFRITVAVGWVCVDMTSAAAARTLDLVTFTAPAGWTVEERAGGIGKYVVMTRGSATSYCMIVIYSSTPASSDLDASFAAEWKSVALQTIDPVQAPKPTMRTVGDARAAVGGATSKAQGQPVMGLLIVLDAGTRVVSMLVLSPTIATFDAYNAEVQAMMGSLVVQRVGEPSQPPVTTSGGKLVVPAPTRTMVVADLAGEWGRNDGINTTYVDRYTGVYAGTDSIHFTEKWVIASKGTISLDFFGIQNGKKIVEKSTGVVTLSATGILVITMTNERRYVLRGWLEGLNMTVMKLNGPWYEGIPADILANPEQGTNLDQSWVRLGTVK